MDIIIDFGCINSLSKHYSIHNKMKGTMKKRKPYIQGKYTWAYLEEGSFVFALLHGFPPLHLEAWGLDDTARFLLSL